MIAKSLPPRMITLASRLRKAESGLALLEFALSLPIVLTLGGYGIELANLAMVNMRVSQYTLDLADNASRVGLGSGLSTTQLRETDVNDVLLAAKMEGAGIKLTTNGRVTISSLENIQQTYNGTNIDAQPVQRLHWQRCIGAKTGTDYESIYNSSIAPIATTVGTYAPNATAAAKPDYLGIAMPSGIGDPGATKVTVPTGSGLIYVEVNYAYTPLFGSMFVSAQKLHYTASYIVRDKRDYSHIYATTEAIPVTPSTCDLHNA
jgi:hypothetical protein